MTAITNARDAWLEKRRSLVTASDVAAILGEDPRRGVLAVYASKVGDVESEETLPMRRGRRWEAVIAEEYAEQTGREVKSPGEYTIFCHPELEWLGATPDRLIYVADRWVPLEIKLAIGSGRDWREEPPLAYLFQLQTQLACMSAALGALAGLVGPGPLAVSDHERDDELFGLMVPRLDHFRWHVAKRLPTACEAEGCVMQADAKPGTSAAVRRLWRTVGRDTVLLDSEAPALVDAWERHKQAARDAEREAAKVENQIRAELGEAAFGQVGDGRFLRRRLVKRDGYTVQPAEYVLLDVWQPKRRAR